MTFLSNNHVQRQQSEKMHIEMFIRVIIVELEKQILSFLFVFVVSNLPTSKKMGKKGKL